MTPLTRNLIRSVAAEEAASACADLSSVLDMAIGSRALCARRRAMVRLMRETGCSATALAKLWGCDPAVVFRARNIQTPPPSVYDLNTSYRLQWVHGQERAASIIAGNDAATSADIAAWRSLGGPR